MAEGKYEGAARRPALEAGRAADGMRRVIVGKETGNDANNPSAQLHTYIDPDGPFAGKIVSENARNFTIEYPEANYIEFQANAHREAITRVTGSVNAGIPNELGSGLDLKPGPSNREIKGKVSADG